MPLGVEGTVLVFQTERKIKIFFSLPTLGLQRVAVKISSYQFGGRFYRGLLTLLSSFLVLYLGRQCGRVGLGAGLEIRRSRVQVPL